MSRSSVASAPKNSDIWLSWCADERFGFIVWRIFLREECVRRAGLGSATKSRATRMNWWWTLAQQSDVCVVKVNK